MTMLSVLFPVRANHALSVRRGRVSIRASRGGGGGRYDAAGAHALRHAQRLRPWPKLRT